MRGWPGWSDELRWRAWLAVILAGFAGAAYGPALNLPFIGDDYVFLDEVRNAAPPTLFSLDHTQFGWYRPWSRGVHFWAIQQVAGVHEVAFRLAGIVLWITALTLYAALIRRLTSSVRVATIAALGTASLALWATPLLWISGSQDLWMVLWVLATLLLFVGGRHRLALIPFGLALLSKETAAVLPALLGLHQIIVERRTVRAALWRTVQLWALVGVWLVVHPTLLRRLADPTWRTSPEGESRPTQVVICVRSFLATFNLDLVPHPVDIGGGDVLRLLTATALLAGATWLILRASWCREMRSREPRGRLTLFALGWIVVGWIPLLLPSIGWHAYYGCLGTLGFWFLVALWLQDRPRVAVAVIACLTVLQWAHANTPSWDWGNEWYQRRAGRFLAEIRHELLERHPDLPPHSRVYFGHVPNNIGLVAGQSPAVRVWYGDPTLQADFYSKYTPRSAGGEGGRDYFFHFDSLTGLVEVRTGPEDVGAALRADPNWETNHEALAMTLLRAGDTRLAAAEFAKLGRLPHRLDALACAVACLEIIGDDAGADSLAAAAACAGRISPARLGTWVQRLRATFPGVGPVSAGG